MDPSPATLLSGTESYLRRQTSSSSQPESAAEDNNEGMEEEVNQADA